MKRIATLLGVCCAVALAVGCSSTQTVSPGAVDNAAATGCGTKADCGACPHAKKEASSEVAPGAVSSGCTKAEGSGCCAKKANGGV